MDSREPSAAWPESFFQVKSFNLTSGKVLKLTYRGKNTNVPMHLEARNRQCLLRKSNAISPPSFPVLSRMTKYQVSARVKHDSDKLYVGIHFIPNRITICLFGIGFIKYV